MQWRLFHICPCKTHCAYYSWTAGERERYIKRGSPIRYACSSRELWPVQPDSGKVSWTLGVMFDARTGNSDKGNDIRTIRLEVDSRAKPKTSPHDFVEKKMNELSQIPFISICHSWMSAVLLSSGLLSKLLRNVSGSSKPAFRYLLSPLTSCWISEHKECYKSPSSALT